MRYVLNLVYLGLLVALAPWWVYAAIYQRKYREGYREKLWGRVPWRRGGRRCIWLHAVSVGEVNLLQPLVDRLPQALPGWECCISTTTKTGYDLARAKYGEHCVFYCPLDFSWAVAAAMRRVRPDILVLAELELWPNLIAAARRHGARVAIVNGRLSEHSARGYRRAGWLIRRLLGRVDLIAAQNVEYGQRFVELGAAPESVVVTGSVKFDGAETDRDNPRTRQLAELAGIRAGDVVLLAGSTQAPEEALALQTYLALSESHPELRLILIPRHPNRFEEVARLLAAAGIPWARRSQLAGANEATAAESTARATRVLLVDTVGELGAWWGTAHIAFVGGSMGTRGGQNMIEPAAYGAAVSFGPRTKNFRDVVRLLQAADAAEVVQDDLELRAFVQRCLEDPAWARALGQRAQDLVRQNLGATDRTLQRLAELVPADLSNQSGSADQSALTNQPTLASQSEGDVATGANHLRVRSPGRSRKSA